MKPRRLVRTCMLGASLFFVTSPGQSQNPSCQAPPCSPNPVPCAHCTGTWRDDGGAVWTVTSNTTPPSIGVYSVSGTVLVPAPVYGCPNITYNVSGSISQTFGGANARGTAAIQWIATNPSPSGSCGNSTPVSSETYNGNILNDGCDFGSGTWNNSSGLNGSFSITKPTDRPDLYPAESSTPIAWYSQNPTIMLYDQTIGSSKYTAGMQVFESSNGNANDGCWFPGSVYAQYSLTGGGWFVGFYFFNNKWEYDYVGFFSQTVDYYRNSGRTPCLVTAPQAMNMYTRDTLSSFTYFTDDIFINLPDNVNYGVARAGVQAWRTYP
jgi:hypothetical protein